LRIAGRRLKADFFRAAALVNIDVENIGLWKKRKECERIRRPGNAFRPPGSAVQDNLPIEKLHAYATCFGWKRGVSPGLTFSEFSWKTHSVARIIRRSQKTGPESGVRK